MILKNKGLDFEIKFLITPPFTPGVKSQLLSTKMVLKNKGLYFQIKFSMTVLIDNL